MQGLDARRAAAETRPTLDIALQRAELVRQFPLFAELDRCRAPASWPGARYPVTSTMQR